MDINQSNIHPMNAGGSSPAPFPIPQVATEGTTYVIVNDPTYGKCALPVGGNGQSACTSEAMGMMLDYAVSTGDKELYTELVNGYAFISSKGNGDGLLPWAFGTDGAVQDKGSATDADIMSLGAMIKGLKAFGSITLGNGQKTEDLIHAGISGLASKDNFNGSMGREWTPGSGWGPTGAVENKFYDYVDFSAAQEILDYANQDPSLSDAAKSIQEATSNYLKWDSENIYEIATDSGTPDNAASMVRMLEYFGNFLADPSHASSPFYAQAKDILTQLVTTALAEGTLAINPVDPISNQGGASVFHGQDNGQYAALGAALAALYGLQQAGVTKVGDTDVASLLQMAESDLATYMKKGDDSQSTVNNLKNEISQHSLWDTGTYFNLMIFSKCWDTIATHDKNLPN